MGAYLASYNRYNRPYSHRKIKIRENARWGAIEEVENKARADGKGREARETKGEDPKQRKRPPLTQKPTTQAEDPQHCCKCFVSLIPHEKGFGDAPRQFGAYIY